jgi:Holliday junction resolvasome RuvABC endonuclease subunit
VSGAQSRRVGTLLALDAGVRETGWAIFRPDFPPATGLLGVASRRRLVPRVRVSQLLAGLDRLVEEWRPGGVAHCQPSGIRWPVPALDLLEAALADWSNRHRLCLYSYTAQEVRSAIAGQPNASRDKLAYEVMVRLGLIGESKTTHEWEALAVGHYHLTRQPGGPGPAPGTPPGG